MTSNITTMMGVKSLKDINVTGKRGFDPGRFQCACRFT